MANNKKDRVVIETTSSWGSLLRDSCSSHSRQIENEDPRQNTTLQR